MEREASEFDRIEQERPALDDDVEPDEPSHDPEAPEADALEQATPVPVDDEDYE